MLNSRLFRTRFFRRAAVALMAAGVALPAMADYPTDRPVQFISPSPPAGPMTS